MQQQGDLHRSTACIFIPLSFGEGAVMATLPAVPELARVHLAWGWLPGKRERRCHAAKCLLPTSVSSGAPGFLPLRPADAGEGATEGPTTPKPRWRASCRVPRYAPVRYKVWLSTLAFSLVTTAHQIEESSLGFLRLLQTAQLGFFTDFASFSYGLSIDLPIVGSPPLRPGGSWRRDRVPRG